MGMETHEVYLMLSSKILRCPLRQTSLQCFCNANIRLRPLPDLWPLWPDKAGSGWTTKLFKISTDIEIHNSIKNSIFERTTTFKRIERRMTKIDSDINTRSFITTELEKICQFYQAFCVRLTICPAVTLP